MRYWKLPLMAVGAMILLHQAAPAAGQQRAIPATAQPREFQLLPDDNEIIGKRDVPLKAMEPQPPALQNIVAFADASSLVFDAELISTTVKQPPGKRVLVTEYQFRVIEWLRGERHDPVIILNEVGGELDDGSGMTTCRSHKLEVGGRYLIFTHQDPENLLAPISAVLQVLDGGGVIANAQGEVLLKDEAGNLRFNQQPGARTVRYLDAPETPGPTRMGPPEFSSEPIPPQDIPEPSAAVTPVSIDSLLHRLRLNDAETPKRIDDVPAGLSSIEPESRYDVCGWHNESLNFYSLLPDNQHWVWFNDAGSDWNNLVDTNPSGPDWLIGHFVDGGGNPYRNVPPIAGDGNNNVAVASSAILTAGGYPTWEELGFIGVAFTWYFNGNCTRIIEIDAFVNPIIVAEAEFRSVMTHELGHTLGLGHESRIFAIMHPIGAPIPPNYSSALYCRSDDYSGVRVGGLGFTNSVEPGTWVISSWADPATWSYTHPNVGTSVPFLGDMVTTLSTFAACQGESITINRMHVENRGLLAATPLDLDIYLSTNNVISTADHLVWSGGWSSFAGQTAWSNGTLGFTIPADIPPGNYYIGWIVSTVTSEPISTTNNTAIMVGYFLGYPEMTIAISSTPLNDDCASAVSLDAVPFASGTTVCASIDGADDCGFSQSSPDVWYSYTAPSNGRVAIDTCGSSYDTVLSVHMGCPGTAANQIACNDQFCGNQSGLEFDVVQGVTYRIRVSGWNSGAGPYQIALTLTCPADLNNDGVIDTADLGILLSQFATIGPGADLNADGVVDTADLGILLGAFGTTCP